MVPLPEASTAMRTAARYRSAADPRARSVRRTPEASGATGRGLLAGYRSGVLSPWYSASPKPSMGKKMIGRITMPTP